MFSTRGRSYNGLLAKFIATVLIDTGHFLTEEQKETLGEIRSKGANEIIDVTEAFHIWFVFLHNFSKSRYTLITSSRSLYFEGTLPA